MAWRISKKNGIIKVLLPNEYCKWTHGPQSTEILPNLYVGNFIASCQAVEFGFNAVLNMAEELDPVFNPVGKEKIIYKKLPVSDGAQNPIRSSIISQAIKWIEEQLKKGHIILVHCRAGIGRSGSIVLAYVYKTHPHLDYSQVLKFIWSKKSNIYPHRELQQTIEKLFPRKDSNRIK